MLSIPYFLRRLFQRKKPLVVICGPTATGKTAKSIELALELQKQGIKAEIISADSRQVYRGLDIGTAKITKDEMAGIPHHMIDIVDPEEVFTVAMFAKQVKEIIKKLHKENKVPILVGGTGMYIDAVIYNQTFPQVLPDQQLRAELQSMSTARLLLKLQELDPERAASIDQKNRVRLVRAIEIAKALGGVPKQTKETSPYSLEIHYLNLPEAILKKRIHKRNVERINNGLIEEVQNLNLSPERLYDLGLEYRYVSEFLDGKIESKEKLIELLDTKTWQFVKRQRTWFKKYVSLN